MQTRRNFLGNVATGLAGSLATGGTLSANDRIRLGFIGAGDRGLQLAREAMSCPGAEVAAFADVYARRREEAATLVPGARVYEDLKPLLADSSIDAVVIATPQHLHAAGFLAAMDAGKHVYLEKTMAFTISEAKAMRVAYRRAGRRTVQIGHQPCSSGHVADARNYLMNTGAVTSILAQMYRNTPHGKPYWSRPAYPDMTEENIDWKSFLGDAPTRSFDAGRYVNWRLYDDYSGGNVFENMCQQIAFWYKAMGLNIPLSAHMIGSAQLGHAWDVPDTMSVAMEHEGLFFSWNSGFGNSSGGVREEVLGTDGTISRGQQIRFRPEKVNRPSAAEMLGQSITPPRAHMQNFLDCIRSGAEPNCPFDLGFRVSVACRMAVQSYLEERRVRWDAVREELI